MAKKRAGGKNHGQKQSLSEFAATVNKNQTQSLPQFEENFDLENIDIEQQRLIFEQIMNEQAQAGSCSDDNDHHLTETSCSNDGNNQLSVTNLEGETTNSTSYDKEPLESTHDDEALARMLQEEENLAAAVESKIIIGGGGRKSFVPTVMMAASGSEFEEDYDDDEFEEDYDEDEYYRSIRGDDNLTLDEESAMDLNDVYHISNANGTGLAGDYVNALMRADTKVLHTSQFRDHSAHSFSSRRNKKETIERIRSVDKQDERTTDKVLDHRTSMILYKLMNSGIVTQLNGCVSTGKESHVFHATGCLDEITGDASGAEVDFCIKIFKVVGASFKRMKDKMKANSQKNIKIYAEKEMRNLKKLNEAGVSCPTPYLVKDHVILMSFIGKQGFPAPALKDVTFTSVDKLKKAYTQVITNMRKMYQKAKLIHSDLSEYNILYLHGEVYIIDVSQAVESHHANAKSFLVNDCRHINQFFAKQGLTTILTDKELFDYVIQNVEGYMTEDELLETTLCVTELRDISMMDQTQDDKYFAQVCLPQSSIDFDDNYHAVAAHSAVDIVE
ncbi:hypothetical protein C9374_012075 [Naegleria lovaniensis]|uniref:non-specific serine/threonine protein kinase n=2 Tax=Naegleria lovaniensis TaxID=51637 RepID=A0AA88GEN7_NAELO|nr:uncharacterized protein C9374_012075 [Naegleria lovaniensis]KAG2373468.1 hypothetical protein C9374_012075 [Naegleria lovaniensis]